MEIVFESILLFSLAILVIAIGLLVYYFKKRIADIEQKNTKCLEIVHDVFVQHMQLKAEVTEITQNRTMTDFYQHENQDDRIKIHLEENYNDSHDIDADDESNADADDEADDDADNDDVKIVNVNLSGPIDSDINITDEIDDQFDLDAQQSSTFEVLDAREPNVFTLTNVDNQSETISKIDVNESDLESDSEMSTTKNNESFRDLFNPETKESYKKMDIKSIRRLVVSRGLATESTPRMRKNELIDVLLTIV
jgi:hypothetical protein